MSKQKVAIIPAHIQQRVDIIKEFADKMGYTVRIEQYDRINQKDNSLVPYLYVELVETRDHEEYPYSWQWNLKTGKELM